MLKELSCLKSSLRVIYYNCEYNFFNAPKRTLKTQCLYVLIDILWFISSSYLCSLLEQVKL
jgi:hypothetical protein